MFQTTLPHLKCPRQKRKGPLCSGDLKLTSQSPGTNGAKKSTNIVYDIESGTLQCQRCHAKFPILGGVALLVADVQAYLVEHAKGIARIVPDSKIPKEFLKDFLQAKAEIYTEHIEDDLEAERIVSLYILNHYLRVSGRSSSQNRWWKTKNGEGSPFINLIIEQYWDHGPFSQITKWMAQASPAGAQNHIVELGCGVGGLYPALKARLGTGVGSYLGVDSSFLSIAVARHLALGAPFPGKIKYPEDLLSGGVSAELKLPSPAPGDGKADYVVGHLDALPLQPAQWEVSVALNAIDMLDDPAILPKLQYELVKKAGLVIQSCPYIWHPGVARRLRKRLPEELRASSSRAVERLYEQAGLEIKESVEHIPWLFYKHLRQLEIYSVHAFVSQKNS